MDPALLNVIHELCKGRLPWPLFLYGKQGRGKTAAALAVHNRVFPWYEPFGSGDSRPATSLYIEVEDLVAQINTQYRDGPGFLWQEVSGRQAQLVVLDEVGARNTVSDAHYHAVKKVLDYRQGRPLIIVSNHPIPKIAEIYDARIASRCAAGTRFELLGNDRRIG